MKSRLTARAVLKIRHRRRYDYDEKRGIWLYKKVDEDEEVGNILTDAGRRTLHTFIYGTAAQRATASLGAGMHFIGLSNDGTAPAASDSSLAGELSGDGLDRVEGTVTLPTGANTLTTVENVFTYSGGPDQDVQKTALFDAAVGGNMAHEVLFTQRTLATTDTLETVFEITLT